MVSRDAAFEVFIIESETRREKRKERRERRKAKKEREGKHLGATRKKFQSMAILIYERCMIKVETRERSRVETDL